MPDDTQPAADRSSGSAGAAATPELALEVEGLSKVYGRAGSGARPALRDIDLQVRPGELFGLLGPNGAGKSTLINILAGLVVKTAGRVRIWGTDIDADPRNARSAIGVVPQELNIDAFFTPRETLDIQAGMYGVPRAERRTAAILDMVGLGDKADAYTRSLSGGMRRRLLIAKAMVHAPPVLVLDEPTAGVDVELRRRLWDNVRELNARGVTVLLTTHYLEEAEALCDRIAIIDHGTLIACEPTRDLVGRVDRKDLYLAVDPPVSVVPAALSGLGFERTADGGLHVRYAKSRVRVSRLLGAVQAAGLAIVDVQTRESDLEAIFLELTGSSPAPDNDEHAA